MESIGDARSFLSAAREVALTKPIIVIKAGRTEAAAKAAASHTGSPDRQRRGARRRLPPLRRAARRPDRRAVLHGRGARQAAAARRGPRLTIVTNAGGPGVLATDALIARRRRAGRRCRPRRIDGAERLLPAALEPRQPDRHPRRRRPRALRQGAGDRRQGPEQRRPAGDPDAPGDDRPDPDRRAAQGPTPSIEGKPVLASWMGGRRRRGRRGDPATGPASRPSPTPTPPPASSTTCGATAYNLRGLYETPALADDSDDGAPTATAAEALIAGGPRRGPDAAHRGRVEAAAGRLRHPDRRDQRRRRRGRGRRARPRRSATRSC